MAAQLQVAQPQPKRAADWRQVIRRDLGWLLILKAAALGFLWFVFFSGTRQTTVDAAAASRHLAIAAPADSPPVRATSIHTQKEATRD